MPARFEYNFGCQHISQTQDIPECLQCQAFTGLKRYMQKPDYSWQVKHKTKYLGVGCLLQKRLGIFEQ